MTCPVPHPCLSRATDDRIFWATIVESSTTSSSFRHQSHAPQLARRVGLAEVLDERTMPAARAARVPLHVGQQRASARRQLAVRLEHLPPANEIGAGVDQHALGRQPVAARAARFLLVVLCGPRRAGMHDEAHVRSIDAHAERHRGDDDVGALLEKGFLAGASDGIGKARVVRHRAMAFFDKPRRERLDLAPRQAVHDAGVAVVAIENRAKLAVQIASTQHAIGQIRPVEGADEHRRFVQPQLV